MGGMEYPVKILEKQVSRAWEIAQSRYPSMSLAREELLKLQRERLRGTVSFAKRNSVFYRRSYADIDENNFRLQDLPIIDKSVVMAEFDGFLTDGRCSLQRIEEFLRVHHGAVLDGEFNIRLTSGTSGLRGIFVYDNEGWAHVLSGFFLVFPNTSPVSPDQRLGTFISKNQIDISQSILPFLKRAGIQALETYYEDPINECLPKLNAFQPDILSGYSYSIHMLCHEQMAGNLRIQPKRILCGGETCSEPMKALWKKVWNGVDVIETYGASESVLLASECGEHRMHIYEDLNILEVVDENNQPVTEGKPGYKILLTRLYNNLQPLIRYELPDSIVISSEPCPCGCAFRTLQKVTGKSGDICYFTGSDGKRVAVHPNILREAVDAVEDIRRYQITIRGNRMQVKIEDKPGARRKQNESFLASRIAESLHALNVATAPEISFEYVREMPETEILKEKNVIYEQT